MIAIVSRPCRANTVKLEPVVGLLRQVQSAERSVSEAEEVRQDGDRELREMAAEESEQAQQQLTRLQAELQRLLLRPDPKHERNIFLEIRAGTGGQEAGPVCRGSAARVFALRGTRSLEGSKSFRPMIAMPARFYRESGRSDHRSRRLFATEIRVRWRTAPAGAATESQGGSNFGLYRRHSPRSRRGR